MRAGKPIAASATAPITAPVAAPAMTPADIGARMVELLGADVATASVSGGGSWARATVDVPPGSWAAAVRHARDDAHVACDFFDWLTAVDELADGFSVVTHLWSTVGRHGVLIRTRVPRDSPSVDSIVGIYPGAAWPERETHEMFDIGFAGHDNLRPLLLPPEFEGHPMRKEFILASRVAKAWPGAKEPGESHEPGTARRSPMRPPGVPDPHQWGPNALPTADPAGGGASTDQAGMDQASTDQAGDGE